MSFSFSETELDELFERLPALAGRARRLEELPGGLTNRNVKVTTADGVYVARCCDTTSNLLGIDRDQEYFNTKAAAQAGVGAPVIDYRPEMGILLLGYLEGTTLTNTDFQRPGVLAKAATAIRTLHEGPRFRGDFNMFELQPSYLHTLEHNGFEIPSGYLGYADRFAQIQTVLGTRDQTTVPCNNDLLAGNFIEDGDEVRLIDYEYSGNNDPCFELGNVWSECGLTLEQLDELVTAYYGRALRHKLARARLQGIVSKYGWTLWGCIQSASCALDFDFWGWAMERYDGAVAEFDGPDFDRLLDDATAPD